MKLFIWRSFEAFNDNKTDILFEIKVSAKMSRYNFSKKELDKIYGELEKYGVVLPKGTVVERTKQFKQWADNNGFVGRRDVNAFEQFVDNYANEQEMKQTLEIKPRTGVGIDYDILYELIEKINEIDPKARIVDDTVGDRYGKIKLTNDIYNWAKEQGYNGEKVADDIINFVNETYEKETGFDWEQLGKVADENVVDKTERMQRIEFANVMNDEDNWFNKINMPEPYLQE